MLWDKWSDYFHDSPRLFYFWYGTLKKARHGYSFGEGFWLLPEEKKREIERLFWKDGPSIRARARK